MSDDVRSPYPEDVYRTSAAAALITSATALPALALALGWGWFLDLGLMPLALIGGYAAGAWLPRALAVGSVLVCVIVLVVVNQLDDQGYHWLDDTVFFLVVVGGAAGGGWAVTLRARQVERLQRLAAELDEQQRVDVAAARLEEQTRVQQEVHTRLAERIAAIVVRSQGAQRARDTEALEVLESEARGVIDQLRAALGSLAVPVEEEVGAEPDPDPPLRPSPLDLALAGSLGLALAIESVVHPLARGPLWANVLASLAVAATLVVRRGHPVAATALSLLGAVAMSTWLTPVPATVTGVALLVIVLYSIGAWCRAWWWVPVWGFAVAMTVAMEHVSGLADDGVDGDPGWIVLLWTVAAVGVGRLSAGWQERVRRTERVVAELERGRGAATRMAAAHERQALASELHDTVAHAMTVVCLQAGAHRRTGGDAGSALRTIATTAAGSLAELREGLDAIETTAHPLESGRLSAIGRRVGIEVTVTAPHPAPSGPAAALAFRVVREALVNVARHAPGAEAEVNVSRVGDTLRVEVLDAGSASPPVVSGSGAGLSGLAQVVRSAGGTLGWGPRAEGGFAVAAEIPEDRR